MHVNCIKDKKTYVHFVLLVMIFGGSSCHIFVWHRDEKQQINFRLYHEMAQKSLYLFDNDGITGALPAYVN